MTGCSRSTSTSCPSHPGIGCWTSAAGPAGTRSSATGAGARVVALDLNAADVAGVAGMLGAMDRPASRTGRAPPWPSGRRPPPAVPGRRLRPRHRLRDPRAHPGRPAAIAEAVRVLRPAGTLAVTVPRWWPERVCWALSDAYHQVEGGHVRIYQRRQLLGRLRGPEWCRWAPITPTRCTHRTGGSSACSGRTTSGRPCPGSTTGCWCTTSCAAPGGPGPPNGC